MTSQETSLSSRELVAKIALLYVTDGETYIYTVKAAALIDAYVLVREAEARVNQTIEARRIYFLGPETMLDWFDKRIVAEGVNLATARKQLGEKVK